MRRCNSATSMPYSSGECLCWRCARAQCSPRPCLRQRAVPEIASPRCPEPGPLHRSRTCAKIADAIGSSLSCALPLGSPDASTAEPRGLHCQVAVERGDGQLAARKPADEWPLQAPTYLSSRGASFVDRHATTPTSCSTSASRRFGNHGGRRNVRWAQLQQSRSAADHRRGPAGSCRRSARREPALRHCRHSSSRRSRRARAPAGADVRARARLPQVRDVARLDGSRSRRGRARPPVEVAPYRGSRSVDEPQLEDVVAMRDAIEHLRERGVRSRQTPDPLRGNCGGSAQRL